MNNNNIGKLSLIAVTILVATVGAYPSKPSFLGCQSSEDCGMDECCVLGTYLPPINNRITKILITVLIIMNTD